MRVFGIHLRLLLAGILLIGATTFAFGYMAESITHQFVQSRFEKRIEFLAKYLALNAELGILIDQRAMLKRLAENLLSEKDVTRVIILNEQDDVLTDVAREFDDPLSWAEVPVTVKKSSDILWNIGQPEGVRVIGRVRIAYSTEGINRLLRLMNTRFMWISAGLTLFCAFVFYFISRSIVFPVTRLAATARQVAKGDLEIRAAEGRLPETRELARAFNAMLDSLQESQAALRQAQEEMVRQRTLARMGEFSMMIAHEVKNPLSIIKSSLDILKKEIPNASENTMVRYMEDEIRRLNTLIEDFLTFARPTVPAFRETDLNLMLQENVSRFEVQLNGSSVRLIRHLSDIPCVIEADRDLLMRAVGNILKNAGDAVEENGCIEIRATCGKNEWIAEIENEGGCIAPDQLEKIFEPFFTTKAKGTGLGLAFTKQVVNAHKGTIGAENRSDGKGVLFRITLPVGLE